MSFFYCKIKLQDKILATNTSPHFDYSAE